MLESINVFPNVDSCQFLDNSDILGLIIFYIQFITATNVVVQIASVTIDLILDNASVFYMFYNFRN